MLLKPHTDSLRNARPLRAIASCALLATLLAGCATDRLVATAPQGVDLSGEWRLNADLSDDPQRLEEPKEQAPRDLPPSRSPGGFGRPGIGQPGMPGGPGSLDPADHGDPPTTGVPRSGVTPVLYEQSTALPASASDGDSGGGGASGPAAKTARDGSPASHMLDAPPLLKISQSGSKVIVKSMSDGTSDEYTAGEQRTIPFGRTEADRSSGWRESAFVVITKARKGPSKEDDFALDAEGHLIFATLVTHVKKGPIDFKRVYDRVRTPN